MTATEPVSQPDNRLDDFRQLVDEASEAFENADGGTLRRLWSALSIFRGRWAVVFRGIFAWASQQTAADTAPGADDVDRAVEQALTAEAAEAQSRAAPPASEPESRLALAGSEHEQQPAPATADRGATPPAAAPDAQRRRQADEKLVNDVRVRRDRTEGELAADARRLRFLELFVGALLLLAAVIALVVATIGAVTILTNPTAGAVVAAVALVPGGGAAILFRFWRVIAERRHKVDAARERNSESLESIEARLSVGDDAERDRLVAEYAAALRSK